MSCFCGTNYPPPDHHSTHCGQLIHRRKVLECSTFFTSAAPPELGGRLVGLIHRRFPPRLTTPTAVAATSPSPPSRVASARLDPDRGADSGGPAMDDDTPASPAREELTLPPPRFRILLAPPRLLVLLALPRLAPLPPLPPPPPPLSDAKRPLSGKDRIRRLDLPVGPLLLLVLTQAARTLDAALKAGEGDGGARSNKTNLCHQ